MRCDEGCWETWVETEDGRQITYVVRTCDHGRTLWNGTSLVPSLPRRAHWEDDAPEPPPPAADERTERVQTVQDVVDRAAERVGARPAYEIGPLDFRRTRG